MHIYKQNLKKKKAKKNKTKKNYGKHNVFMYYIFLLRILNELSANYIQENKQKSIFQFIYWKWKQQTIENERNEYINTIYTYVNRLRALKLI